MTNAAEQNQKKKKGNVYRHDFRSSDVPQGSISPEEARQRQFMNEVVAKAIERDAQTNMAFQMVVGTTMAGAFLAISALALKSAFGSK